MSGSPDTRSLVSASSQLNLMEIDTVSGTVAYGCFSTVSGFLDRLGGGGR